ncbi:hypothetical protein BJF90_29445 [Pseudonocardia sp. CNS-004]|nr:hypothetical protein BJF90_29445 [Pseudonocardia sp. CNS-004]
MPAPAEPAPADDAPGPPAPPAPAAADERIADLAAVSFATSFPSPVEARWNLGAVLPSLALTLLLLAALALPVGLLNRATAQQPDRVEALLARLRVPPGAGRPAPGAFLTAVAITAVAGAVMLGFLTPAFPFDASAPALLVGLAIAFVLVTAASRAPSCCTSRAGGVCAATSGRCPASCCSARSASCCPARWASSPASSSAPSSRSGRPARCAPTRTGPRSRSPPPR